MTKRLCTAFISLWILSLSLSIAETDSSKSPDIATLEKAAFSGDAQAKFELGRAYFHGRGVSKDVQKSVGLLRDAASQGNVEAMDASGYLYTVGEGVPKDEVLACEWFRKGAEAGFPKAQLHLGLMLRQGKTIELSNEESLKWIHSAADGGFPEAKAVLGRLYFLGDGLQTKDPAKAIPFLREAAAAGDPICENMMGVACRDNAGTEEDLAAAEEWFRKAAKQNNAKAQSNLAHLLGADSPKSPHRKEALMWLIVSSQQGEVTAKKTYDEILPALPSSLLASAQKEADQFLVLQRAAAGKKKQTQASAQK